MVKDQSSNFEARFTEFYNAAIAEIQEKQRQMGFKQGMEEGLEKGVEKGIEKGIEKGLVKGREQQIEVTVLNGYKNGLSLQMLSTLTGLSNEQVQNILNAAEL